MPPSSLAFPVFTVLGELLRPMSDYTCARIDFFSHHACQSRADFVRNDCSDEGHSESVTAKLRSAARLSETV